MIIISLLVEICPAMPESPMKLVSMNINGPTSPSMELILSALSGVLKYKNKRAAESSNIDEIKRTIAMESTLGFIPIPHLQYTDRYHWAF